jgi:hypothetical protein
MSFMRLTVWSILLAGLTAGARTDFGGSWPDLVARVTVVGRESVPVEVGTLFAGARIPDTFSGDQVKNVDGFSWWISRHYALRTDYGARDARRFLELLESAWPHYVRLFGREPAAIGSKRMAVTYGTSRETMLRAMAVDLGHDWDFDGGGITLEGIRAAYAYPSGSLDYHTRYILIHECVHLYQMCLEGTNETTPGWYYEGIADALSSHVYEKATGRITFFVLDKAAIPNFLDEGVRSLAGDPRTMEEIQSSGKWNRGICFLMAQYFLTDPDRAERFAGWRDEVFKLSLRGEKQKKAVHGILENRFGSWDALNAGFSRWKAARRPTFHYVDWGWEQDAGVLWSYGWPQKGPYARTDVNLPPGEKPVRDPFVMDYPRAGTPPEAGKVARGTDEPSIGFVLDFSRNPAGGQAGIGLGVAGDGVGDSTGVRVLVVAGATLLIDGSDLGLERKETVLPDNVRKAMRENGYRIGVKARITKDVLQVVLRAGARTFRESIPVDPASRRLLLDRPVALLSRDGLHGVEPFFDP